MTRISISTWPGGMREAIRRPEGDERPELETQEFINFDFQKSFPKSVPDNSSTFAFWTPL